MVLPIYSSNRIYKFSSALIVIVGLLTFWISHIICTTDHSISYQQKHQQFVKSYIHWVSVVKQPNEWAKTLFATNASFQVGNFQPSIGHEEIAVGATRLYTVLTSLDHSIHKMFSIDEFTCISEGQVVYTVGSKVLDPIPIISIFKFVPSSSHSMEKPLLIQSYRAYVNNIPLFVVAGYDFTTDEDGNTVMVLRKKSPLSTDINSSENDSDS